MNVSAPPNQETPLLLFFTEGVAFEIVTAIPYALQVKNLSSLLCFLTVLALALHD